MAQLQVKTLLDLMSEKNLKPSTKIEFMLAGHHVEPEHIEVRAFEESNYSRHAGYVRIEISKEFIEKRVQERMRALACAQVDAMFEEKPSAAS